MKIGVRAKLEKLIEKLLSETGEERDYYAYTDLASDMTDAAVAVYDASQKAQKFAEEEMSP